MNKEQLITKVAQQTDSTKAQTKRMIDTTINIICKSVKKGDEVKLVGFGTFTKSNRKTRTGRNPKTGKTLKIPSACHPKFRPSSAFKSMLK